MKTNRELLYARNNAYDTVLLVNDGEVIGEWAVTPDVAREYLSADDLSHWEPTWPDETDPADYGEIIDRDDVEKEIDELNEVRDTYPHSRPITGGK